MTGWALNHFGEVFVELEVCHDRICLFAGEISWNKLNVLAGCKLDVLNAGVCTVNGD